MGTEIEIEVSGYLAAIFIVQVRVSKTESKILKDIYLIIHGTFSRIGHIWAIKLIKRIEI